MRSVLLLSLAALLAMGMGCSSSMCETLDSAEKAVLAARAAGAPQYLADEFASLEAALSQLWRERDREGRKLVLLRDYKRATEHGRWVEAEAARLIAATAEKKQRARALSLAALERARQSVQETHALASGATHRELRYWAEAVREDCLVMMDSLERVEKVIAAGDYDAAILKTEAIEEASRLLRHTVKTASSTMAAASREKSARGAVRTSPTQK